MALQRQFVLPPPPNPDEDINGYSWRDWFRQLRDYIVNKGSILWSQIDFTGSKLSDIVNRPHNVLQAKQGGSTALDQFYHLTAVEYTGTGTGVFVRQNDPTINSPNINHINFSGVVPTAPIPAGTQYYDNVTGSHNLIMGGGNITQQIGEEIFIYGKASANITEGQLIVKTGTVGASGVITFGPSPTGLTINDGIIGVATENIALNAFGRVTRFGVVRGINTTGTSVGEVWADNDTLYYNPNYVGGLTKVKPSAPYAKFEIATVINASSGGSGSLQVNLIAGSTLGGTDSNVQFGTLNTSDLIQYNGTYWTNVSPSSVIAGAATAPVTKTADFTVGATDKWIINNKSGSTCTVTLPTASTNTGRELHIQNYQNYTVISASSNVVPIAGGSAGTAILADVAGDTCTLVSDGTNWITTQYTPNNVLLI